MRQQRWPVIAFGGLALLIMGPLLWPGFVFALDMIPTPVWRLPDQVTSSYVFYALMHVLNFVIPADVLQKLLLISIFWLAGLGMYRLARVIQKPKPITAINYEVGAYFAGIFYVVNPYTYSRFMAGQFAVLLGYALLPWFARVLLLFLRKPGLMAAGKLGLLAAIIGVASIHSLGLLLLLSVIALGFSAWRWRHNFPILRKLACLAAISGGVFVLLSGYWLVPLALGRGATASAISGFTVDDRHAFATVGNGVLGRLINISRLEGFWVEGQGLYRMPQTIGPVWWLALVAVLSLIVAGAVKYWRGRWRYEMVLFGIAALLAAMLAAGILTSWLSAHLPLFAGYREPHKFVGLVALAYALFAGNGVVAVLNWSQRHAKQLMLIIVVVVVALPFVLTSSMLLGGGKQLAARHYPASWFTVNKLMDQDHQQFKVLFLPWHQYMHFGFAATIMANPAENFFDKPTLISNNPEFGHSSPNKLNPVEMLVSQDILPAAARGTHIGARLSRLHIKYVVLAEESDSQNYRFLDRQKDLRLVYSDSTIKLYRNTAFGQEEHK